MQPRKKMPRYAGPREKKLATRHLEYIAHAMLIEPESVTISQHYDPIIIQVQQRQFNLTNLLNAAPDFEHLYFSDDHLQAYVKQLANANIPEHQKTFGRHNQPHLSPSEKIALHLWTTNNHYRINALLRSSILDEKFGYTDLLTTCIAASALAKPLHYIDDCTPSFRGEDADHAVMDEREKAQRQGKTVTNKGFTSSSKDINRIFGCVETHFIQPESAYNPIGKHIENIAMIPDEEEVLFPPGTEFVYEKNRQGSYTAIPIRSINADMQDNPPHYQHGFTDKALRKIARAAERLNPAVDVSAATRTSRHCACLFTVKLAIATTTAAMLTTTFIL
tara:strand:+ start:48 stop:1049 length:1002 start_codon:yes stop_codon:yes gene_type:complete